MIAGGSVVRVTAEREGFDAIEGRENYVLVGYGEEGGERYCVLEPLPGSGRFGEFYAHPDDVTYVRSAASQAERMKMPEVEEIIKLLADGIIGGYNEGIELFETTLLKEALTVEEGQRGYPFEQENDFPYGVEFYGRREGGVSFGGVVRLTGLWRADD